MHFLRGKGGEEAQLAMSDAGNGHVVKDRLPHNVEQSPVSAYHETRIRTLEKTSGRGEFYGSRSFRPMSLSQLFKVQGGFLRPILRGIRDDAD